MKKKISVRYFFNFKEDKRLSMETVANNLYSNLKNYKNFKVSKFIPKFSNKNSKIISQPWNLRYNRYINYPDQVKKLKKTDIAHVIDHQYAHLVNHLNAKYKIITVHDLIPVIFKKKIGKNPFLVKHSLSYLKKFDKVIAVSENTKRDIVKYTDCPKENIVVQQNSIEKFFNQQKIDKNKVIRKFKIPINGKKILIIGTSFYKNHKITLKVLEHLKNYYKNIYFIKIGNKFDFKIKESLKKNIIELPKLTRREISKIYKINDVLFFPSVYEGFGLPLLEAINSGIPVVCSDIKVLKEIIKTKKYMASPYDHKKFSKLLVNILENKKEKSKLVKFNLKNIKEFSEKNYFLKLSKIYKELIN
ncbi:glycosyltransferase family 4 protein [Candidatus Pelagibacter sp. HIMB1623]|uniref:glycosyltransferase family 4 protein n=1 Tax=Candidatus Pelagibacter sp. HIMB1623 TaxID=3413358 RepID=UPI003F8455CF